MPVTLRASSSSQREGWVAQVVGMMSALRSCWRIQSQEVLACAYMHMRVYSTHCNALQHTTTHCITIPLTVMHCNTLQRTVSHCITLQHTVTRCILLHHTATHCRTLQHMRIGACMHVNALLDTFRTATHCNNTLQHTALHFSTLQHTATIHRNTVQHTPDAVDASCLRIRT